MTAPALNSSHQGMLRPLNPNQIEDLDLDVFFQGIVRDITGIDGTLVRPRWQPRPPPIPPNDVNWAAIGVINEEPEGNASISHFPGRPTVNSDGSTNFFDSTGDGFDRLQSHLTYEIMASFYGPRAREFCNLFRDGLLVAQNREILQLNDMGVAWADQAGRHVPEMVKTEWYNRMDFTFGVKRANTRYYPVENLLQGVGEIVKDEGSQEGEVRGTQPFDTANRRG